LSGAAPAVLDAGALLFWYSALMARPPKDRINNMIALIYIINKPIVLA
jgi:hypothetical protein